MDIQAQLTPGDRESPQAEIIKSFSYNESTILKGIMLLHCPTGFQLDPTYGKGNIYNGLSGPELKYDLNPKAPNIQKADCRALPFKEGTIKNIVFDPPFLGGGSKKGVMITKFTNYDTVPELWKFYKESLTEFYRILKPKGILIFKCQDMIEGRKQFLSHIEIINTARAIGYYPKDLFILLSKTRIIRANQKQQQHTRKFHCYWLVFQKPNGARAPPIKGK